jgi:hypothetical protein
MLLFSQNEPASTSLTFKYTCPEGTCWRLSDGNLAILAQLTMKIFRRITEGAVEEDLRVLKLNNRKAVFRIEHPEDSSQAFVAKISFYNRIKHRFRFRKYALNEVVNLLKARALGINTPRVCGFGTINDILGLPEASIILTEYLPGVSINSFLEDTESEAKRNQTFMQTIPLFVSLYEAKCNHIDITGKNVLLSDKSLNHDVYLLDFQYARFYNESSSEILMFEAGYFAQSCLNFVSLSTIYEWLDKLLIAANIDCTEDSQKLKSRFEYYLNTDLNRKKRRICIK